MGRAKQGALFVVLVLALYMIVVHPDRATDFVGLGFEGISGAVRGTGHFLTGLVR